MGRVNTATKQYMKKNDKVADVFNFYAYGGKQIIKPENLSELDSAEIDFTYGKNKKGLPVERIRDIVRLMTLKTDGTAVYAILGIENQDKVHYAMPVRNQIYDALAYVNQIKVIADKHKEKSDGKEHSGDEYLSGFYKEDRLFPVITIVVYFGADKWDGPTCLHEMMSVENEEILSLVNNYQIHLITPASLSDEELAKFHTDLKEVLTFIKYSQDEDKIKELLNGNENFASMDLDAARVLQECTSIDIQINKKRKGKVNMCKAWDDHRKRGIEEGMEKGIQIMIETYQELGLNREATIEKVTKKCAVELEKATDYVHRYWVA